MQKEDINMMEPSEWVRDLLDHEHCQVLRILGDVLRIKGRLKSVARHLEALSNGFVEAPPDAVPPSTDEMQKAKLKYCVHFAECFDRGDVAIDNLKLLVFAATGVETLEHAPSDRLASLLATIHAEIAWMKLDGVRSRASSVAIDASIAWMESNPIVIVEAEANADQLSQDDAKAPVRELEQFYGEAAECRLTELCMRVAGVSALRDVPPKRVLTLVLSAQADLHERKRSRDYEYAMECVLDE
jgi:hypothetical protein